MVGKFEVGSGKLILRHMAGDTPRARYRTAGRAVLGGFSWPLACAPAVASLAFGVVKSWLMLRIPMRVVAGQATDPAIKRTEAPAFGQAVRLETHGCDSLGLNGFDVRSRTMAGATELYKVSGC